MKRLVLVLWLLPSLAWAGWTKCPGNTANTDTGMAVLQPGNQETCQQGTTAADPARVDGHGCRGGMDVIFDSDVAGANYDAALTVYQCATTAAQAEPATITDCEALAPSGVVVPLTGNPAGNLDAIYGIAPGYLAFRLVNAQGRNYFIRVICH